MQTSDGNFCGTTLKGGSPFSNGGTVFKLTPGGALSTLYSFCPQNGCADGEGPLASLTVGIDGNLYGETYNGGGGISSGGTVFKITTGGALTTLYSFCAQTGCPDGAQPITGLALGTDGNFYGTTYHGGSDNLGTLFQITPGGSVTPLYPFAGTNGAYPVGELLLASDGTFYGTTQGGGSGSGTVFRLSPTSPTLTLLPPSLGFGNQPVTITSPPQSVTLTNTGAMPLTISSITPSGDFAQTNTCPVSPSTLAAGANCAISVAFTPTATGPRTGSITITDNAANSPQSASLSGNGTDFLMPPASPPSQTVKAGKSAKYTLSVAPTSGFTGTVALSCSGAPPGGTCSVSPASVTLDGTTASTATVTATTAMGKKGTPKGTYTLTLKGMCSTLSHSTQVTLTVQ